MLVALFSHGIPFLYFHHYTLLLWFLQSGAWFDANVLGYLSVSGYYGKHMRDEKKRVIKRAIQVFASSFIAVALIGIFVFVTQGRDIPVLNPQGEIANQQYTLILITVVLGMFVIIPVFILLFTIAWKYRAGNKKAKYEPDLEGNTALEVLWWVIPFLIILVLAIITHISTHALDPYKELKSDKKAVTVQVVSLKWNWLFIYPENGTATLNYMNIPEKTPINLTLTSDSPMNSFWVPALAGQVYTMSGMSTKLHLMADKVGTYNGSTANISGEGYADLRFKVNSMSEADFKTWIEKAAHSSNMLTMKSYQEITDAHEHMSDTTYMLMATGLYDSIVMKYMHSEKQDNKQTEEHEKPSTQKHEEAHSETHEHTEGMEM